MLEMAHPFAFDDDCPTSTRFMRNCEEIGLFNDLQHNPFEETFKIAIKSSPTDETSLLKESSWKQLSEDTLNTPQILPCTKPEDSQSIFVEEDDDFVLPESFLIESVLPDKSTSCEEKDCTSNDSSDVEIIEEPVFNGFSENSCESQGSINSSVHNSILRANNIAYLSGNAVSKIKNTGSTFIIQNGSTYTTSSNTGNNKHLSFQQVDIKNSENVSLVTASNSLTTQKVVTTTNNSDDLHQMPVSRFPIVLSGKNVVLLPTMTNSNKSRGTYIQTIAPKPDSAINKQNLEIGVKQKLKSLIENSSQITLGPAISNVDTFVPTDENIPENDLEFDSVQELHKNQNDDSISWTIEDKKEYSRERNRMAQKRCRMKKKRYVMQLKKETDCVVSENQSLHAEVDSLRAEIAHLKTLLLAHRNCSVTKAMFKADLAAIFSDDISGIAENIEIHLPDSTDDYAEHANVKNIVNHQLVNQINQHVNHIHLHVPQQKIKNAIKFLCQNFKKKKNMKNELKQEQRIFSQPEKVQRLQKHKNSKTLGNKKLIFDSKVVRIKPDDRLSHAVLRKNTSQLFQSSPKVSVIDKYLDNPGTAAFSEILDPIKKQNNSLEHGDKRKTSNVLTNPLAENKSNL